MKLDAYILSISKYADLSKSWGNRDASKAEFKKQHVLFIEEDKAYLKELFEDV